MSADRLPRPLYLYAHNVFERIYTPEQFADQAIAKLLLNSLVNLGPGAEELFEADARLLKVLSPTDSVKWVEYIEGSRPEKVS